MVMLKGLWLLCGYMSVVTKEAKTQGKREDVRRKREKSILVDDESQPIGWLFIV